MNNTISSLERQNQILQFIHRSQRISIMEVCENFSVSEATARRDLENLASEGKIQRVHGGAITLTEAPPESPLLQRDREQADEKACIGQAAAALVRDGETVFLGSGTTVLEVARALRTRPTLTVITNSLPVVNVFAGLKNINVICLGGMLRDSELSFIGHITEQALAEVRADKVFIGTRSISLEHGLTHEYLPETMTDRAILKAGQEIIVVADHTKFGRAATVLLAPLESIHTIVTDKQTPQDFLDAVQQRGLHVVLS
jgi:DeoR family transcriptional regulator, aga operon transcriptional repressor